MGRDISENKSLVPARNCTPDHVAHSLVTVSPELSQLLIIISILKFWCWYFGGGFTFLFLAVAVNFSNFQNVHTGYCALPSFCLTSTRGFYSGGTATRERSFKVQNEWTFL